jgi:hypothetical protein
MVSTSKGCQVGAVDPVPGQDVKVSEVAAICEWQVLRADLPDERSASCLVRSPAYRSALRGRSLDDGANLHGLIQDRPPRFRV